MSKDDILNKLIISDRAGETYKNSYTSNLSQVKQDKGFDQFASYYIFIDSSSVNNEDDYNDFVMIFNFYLAVWHQQGFKYTKSV